MTNEVTIYSALSERSWLDDVKEVDRTDIFHTGNPHGVQITFKNRWMISIQWSTYHYSDGMTTCEIAIFKPDGSWYTCDDPRAQTEQGHTQVWPDMSVADMLERINFVRMQS